MDIAIAIGWFRMGFCLKRGGRGRRGPGPVAPAARRSSSNRSSGALGALRLGAGSRAQRPDGPPVAESVDLWDPDSPQADFECRQLGKHTVKYSDSHHLASQRVPNMQTSPSSCCLPNYSAIRDVSFDSRYGICTDASLGLASRLLRAVMTLRNTKRDWFTFTAS